MKLEVVIDKTLELLQKMEYTEQTWKIGFCYGRFNGVRTFYEERGETEFSVGLTREYIASVQRRYENQELSYNWATHLKKKAARLIEVYETGELKWRMPNKSKISVNPYFTDVWQKYLKSKVGTLSSSNIIGQKSTILHLLGFLQHEKQYSDFSPLTRQDVHDFIQFKSRRYNGRMDRIFYGTKSFLRYLYEQGIIPDELTNAMYQPAQKKHKVLPGFTHAEVECILAQPARATVTGKRDYAILLLAKNTGLRIGDIIGLRLSNIDWKKSELAVVQRKTGQALLLPLDGETQSAIAEYILNGRPQHACPYIFMKSNAPYGPLTSQAVVTLFRKYRFAAGIDPAPHCGKSFHGLRRSIAHWMLEADVPLTTISQVLGHGRLDSAAPYLSFDEKNLRMCALGLDGVECRKEGLA